MSATTRTSAREPPELLEWDTEFWGLRVARAGGIPEDDSLSRWALENTVGLMCLLIDADEPGEARRAEEAGFRFTDVRVTLARTTAPFPSSARMHRAEDVGRLAAIARSSHRITRFYADPSLADERADDLYESWIRKSASGWAQRVLVVDDISEGAVGYVTVHAAEKASSIGLIAVAESARRLGLGGELVRGALDFAYSRDAEAMTVVTQGRNVAAQRLFQACGFRTTNTSLWFHKRYDEAP